MVDRRVGVRLSASGGRGVKAELDGVGQAGSRTFGGMSRDVDDVNRRLAAFARRATIAATAAATAVVAAGAAMVRNGLETIDAQAKLAQSLDTTTESVQVLARAGELAGVAFTGIEQATKDLTRRLSQAAAGTGPAADALDRLGLSAEQLMAMPLDRRVAEINAAIERFVPAAERAAVAGQLFGEEGSIAAMRLDPSTIRQAADELDRFGVIVSEVEADQVERTNDALTRLGLVGRGLTNQLTAAAAPAIERTADLLAGMAEEGTALNKVMTGLVENIDKVALAVGALATLLTARLAAGAVAATVAMVGLTGPIGLAAGTLAVAGAAAVAVASSLGALGRETDTTGGELIRLNREAGNMPSALDAAVQPSENLAKGLTSLGTGAGAGADGIARLNEEVDAYLAKVSENPDALVLAREFVPGLGQAVLDRVSEGAGALGTVVGDAIGEGTTSALDDLEADIEAFLNRPTTRPRARPAAPAAADGVARSASGAASAVDDVASAYENLLASLDPALARMQEYTERTEVLNAALEAGVISQDEFTKAMKLLEDNMNDVGSAAERVTDQMASTFASIVTGADDARTAIGRLLDSFANQLATSAFTSLFGPLLGGLSIPGFASGTAYAPGGLAMVGERGPELVSLPRGSRVLDAETTRGMGGQTVILNVDARGAQIGVAEQVEMKLAEILPRLMQGSVAANAEARRRGYA